MTLINVYLLLNAIEISELKSSEVANIQNFKKNYPFRSLIIKFHSCTNNLFCKFYQAHPGR